VRELEQCVRRILLTNRYEGDVGASATDLRSKVFEAIDTGAFDAQSLLSAYCFLLYQRHPTYAEVARRTRPRPQDGEEAHRRGEGVVLGDEILHPPFAVPGTIR